MKMIWKRKSEIKINIVRFCIHALTETAPNLVSRLHKIASRLPIIPASCVSTEQRFFVAMLLSDGLRNCIGKRLLNDNLTVYLNCDAK